MLVLYPLHDEIYAVANLGYTHIIHNNKVKYCVAAMSIGMNQQD